MKKLSNRTIGELKLMARESGIELPAGAIKKAQILEAIEASGANVITSGNTVSPSGAKTSGLAPVKDGIMGSSVADQKPVVKNPPKEEKTKVALHSNKNVSWVGVGKLTRGYNFVSEVNAEKWLKRVSSVRLADPKEVADHYGVE